MSWLFDAPQTQTRIAIPQIESYKHDNTHDSAYWVKRANDRLDGTDGFHLDFHGPSAADIDAAILFLTYARTAELADAGSAR